MWKWLSLLLVVFVSVGVFAEDTAAPPKPLLVKGDVERFIKTFPVLIKDLETLGMKYDVQEGTATVPKAVMASMEVKSTLQKHGWTEEFYKKMAAILQGYASLEYGKAMGKVDEEMAKALKQVEDNAFLSDEQKAMIKAQLQEAQGQMGTVAQDLSKTVHPKDMQMIKPHIASLKKVLEAKVREVTGDSEG